MRRALHYVFKVGNRKNSFEFYTKILGMKILRHEEFEEGCKATCNGPYDGKWSKTMIGYGPEDSHFVIEVTYNYGIGAYCLGNDFVGIWIRSLKILDRAKDANLTIENTDSADCKIIRDPDGHAFYIVAEEISTGRDPVEKVAINCSSVEKSLDFWKRLCSMKEYGEGSDRVLLAYDHNQCKLELRLISSAIDRGTGFGRIAFSCPRDELKPLEELMKREHQTILIPFTALDTPGKATVEVVILADPNGHEICFVGDEAFRQLSKIDPNAELLLKEAIENDDSVEWFNKMGGKPAAK